MPPLEKNGLKTSVRNRYGARTPGCSSVLPAVSGSRSLGRSMPYLRQAAECYFSTRTVRSWESFLGLTLLRMGRRSDLGPLAPKRSYGDRSSVVRPLSPPPSLPSSCPAFRAGRRQRSCQFHNGRNKRKAATAYSTSGRAKCATQRCKDPWLVAARHS